MNLSKETRRQNITTWPELGINYWGIQKNATSTLITHFYDIVTNFSVDLGDKINQQNAKHLVNTRYIDRNCALNNGLKNFAIVRNPYDRFVSCYKMFAFPKNYTHESAAHKARFNSTWTIDDFLNDIEYRYSNNKKINKHYLKQTWFIPDTNSIDHLIKLENITKDWPLEIPLPSFKSNTTSEIKLNFNKEKLYDIYKEDFISFNYKNDIL